VKPHPARLCALLNSYNNSSIRYPGIQSASSTAAIYFVDEFGKSLEMPLVVLGAVKVAIGDRPVIKIILFFSCIALKFGILSKGKIIHISISHLVIVSTERSQIELKQSDSINKPGFFFEKIAFSNYFS
jgi:hypothetical protein